MTPASRCERIALAAAARGYHVFPCWPRDKRPRVPKSEGGKGFKDATRDEGHILRWWDRWPDANVGIACGASGMVVLDIDSKSGADPREVVDQLELHDYPQLLTGEAPAPDRQHPHSLTGVRGVQVWYRGDLPTAKTTLQGVEFRGVGGYVMAPGSAHPSAVEYEVVGGARMPPAAKLPPVPERVLAITEPAPAKEGGRTPVEVWLGIVEHGVAEGDRHRQLLRMMGHLLRRYVATDLVAALAHCVNERCQPPLEPDDLDSLIEDACALELHRRQGGTR